MGWIIIIAFAYAPIIYNINRRLQAIEEKLNVLESEVKRGQANEI